MSIPTNRTVSQNLLIFQCSMLSRNTYRLVDRLNPLSISSQAKRISSSSTAAPLATSIQPKTPHTTRSFAQTTTLSRKDPTMSSAPPKHQVRIESASHLYNPFMLLLQILLTPTLPLNTHLRSTLSPHHHHALTNLLSFFLLRWSTSRNSPPACAPSANSAKSCTQGSTPNSS